MTRVTLTAGPGGVRAVWPADADLRPLGFAPARASHIEVVPPGGPAAGRFYVDFGPLADATGDGRYRVCLAATFALYDDARRAEVAWLEAHYLTGAP